MSDLHGDQRSYPHEPVSTNELAPVVVDDGDKSDPHHFRIFSSQDKGRYALITLTLINLLNYIDRYVPSASKQYFQSDLHLTDTETSVPLTAFVFVYMLCSPVFSYLADIGFKRPRLIASGVVIWSIATAAGALAVDFWTLLISRSLVGVGEAAYATIAPALLSDYYPPNKRNAVLSFFYLAIPVGAAMGYAVGGEVGQYLGWRYAFLVSGAPGLVVAAMCLLINEPPLGAADEIPQHHAHASQHDLMFGLNEEGMADDTNVDPSQPGGGSVMISPVANNNKTSPLRAAPAPPVVGDDDDEDDVAAFAVQSELGGPAATHPHSHVHAHAHDGAAATAASQDREASRSILVKSQENTVAQQPLTSDGQVPAYMSAPPWIESFFLLINNPSYMYATMGLTAVTFASGGMADWMPSYLNRVLDMSKDSAATSVGAITCVAGILGTAYGSWAGERAKGVIRQPYLGVPGLNMIITCACSWVIMIVPNIYIVGGLIFIAQIAMWAYTGPINSLTVNCVPANLRVRAFALQILISHALGDAISPTIVGAVSSATGSIRTAMFIIPFAFTLGMLCWLIGWYRLADSVSFDGYDDTSARTPRLSNAQYEEQINGSLSNGRDPLRNPLMQDYGGDSLNDGNANGSGNSSYTNSLVDQSNAIHLKRLEASQQRREDIM